MKAPSVPQAAPLPRQMQDLGRARWCERGASVSVLSVGDEPCASALVRCARAGRSLLCCLEGRGQRRRVSSSKFGNAATSCRLFELEDIVALSQLYIFHALALTFIFPRSVAPTFARAPVNTISPATNLCRPPPSGTPHVPCWGRTRIAAAQPGPTVPSRAKKLQRMWAGLLFEALSQRAVCPGAVARRKRPGEPGCACRSRKLETWCRSEVSAR